MRPSWDQFFFNIAREVATRSTCLRRQIGCVIEYDHTIIATGFNGPPRGYPHCTKCAREGLPSGTRVDLSKAAHAESNAIANAARMGIRTLGSELYLSEGLTPCTECTKLIVNAGISVVHILVGEGYPDWSSSREMLETTGVKIIEHRRPS